jgi:hypothetical protein
VTRDSAFQTPNNPTGHDWHWHWRDGLVAAAVALACGEGIYAGSLKSCVQAFDLGMLLTLFFVFNLFGFPIILFIFCSLPALLISAIPRFAPRTERIYEFALAALLVVAALAAVVFRVHGLEYVLVGPTVGLGLRASPMIRRFWIPLGAGATVILCVIVFSFSSYELVSCQP